MVIILYCLLHSIQKPKMPAMSRAAGSESPVTPLGLRPELLGLHVKLEGADLVHFYFKLWQMKHLLFSLFLHTMLSWQTAHCFSSLLEEGYQR